jgi:hypothetical protein
MDDFLIYYSHLSKKRGGWNKIYIGYSFMWGSLSPSMTFSLNLDNVDI